MEKFLQASIFTLALAFTLSCSDSNDNGGGEPNQGGKLCDGVSYDPSVYECKMGELIGSCKGKDYYVAYERCEGGVVVDKDGGSSSSSSVMQSSNVQPSSSSSVLSSSSTTQSSSSALSSSSMAQSSSSGKPCTAADNTETYYCSNGNMKTYGSTPTIGGRTYKTVVIGEQTWMAENLNYAIAGSKCGGDELQEIKWEDCPVYSCTELFFFLEDRNTTNCDKYGRLYNWATAIAICPSGWHLPSDAEWDVLVNYAGGSSTAGTKLKAVNNWYFAVHITDDYGFSARPGGSGSVGTKTNTSGILDISNFFGKEGNWWSSTETENNTTAAYYRHMNSENTAVVFNSRTKANSYLSVRCIKD